jgi:hypothetical protein
MLYISTLQDGERYTGIWGHHPTQGHYAATVIDGTQCFMVKRQRDAQAFENVTQYAVKGNRLTKTNAQPIWELKL